MKFKTLVLLGVSLATLPAFATDTLRIKNKAERPLHFSVRCLDTDSDWKKFEVQPGEVREVTAASCQKFGFKKTTTKPGANETVHYTLDANTSHYLTYDASMDRYDLKKVKHTDF